MIVGSTDRVDKRPVNEVRATKPYQWGDRTMRKRLLPLILLLLLVGAGYYLYRFGLRKPSWDMLTSKVDDTSITEKVKVALSLSKHLAGSQVNVKSEDAVVTLSGQVSSDESKNVAESIARDTTGVKDVKDLLVVNPTANESAESSRVRDIDIRADLLQSILKSPTLSNKKIDVKVEKQVVTLSGTVDTQADRNGAEQLARSIDGVTSVTNNLAVANPTAATEPPSAPKPSGDPNTDLAKRVEFELFRSGAFDLTSLKVAANNGAITLSGSVRSKSEELLAERITQGVDGVKTVKNDLRVSGKPSKSSGGGDDDDR